MRYSQAAHCVLMVAIHHTGTRIRVPEPHAAIVVPRNQKPGMPQVHHAAHLTGFLLQPVQARHVVRVPATQRVVVGRGEDASVVRSVRTGRFQVHKRQHGVGVSCHKQRSVQDQMPPHARQDAGLTGEHGELQLTHDVPALHRVATCQLELLRLAAD